MKEPLEALLFHEQISAAVRERGFFHHAGGSQAALVEVLEALGRPIYVEEVRDTPGAVALVKSRVGIPWHTDHHRAESIVWLCLKQADEGGETLLVDGHVALGLLSREHQEALGRIELFEHSVFRGDGSRHPMIVRASDGRVRLYYSLWLADDLREGQEREAYLAFCEALGRVEPHRVRLTPGDILAIDNTRMLHARTEIRGANPRHLRRYWLAAR